MNRHQFVARKPMKHAGARGFSVWAVSINLLLLGALLVMAFRVMPKHMKYLKIKDLITSAVNKYDLRSESVIDMKVWLAKLLNTNQIYDISIDDIEVYRARGSVVIDANYEKRFPVSGYWTAS
jgi:cell division protein FtsL